MEFASYTLPFITYKISELYKRWFSETIIAETSLGPIKGNKISSYFGYKYIAFQGIPYAEPPVGALRFKDPEPAKPWTNPLNTTSDTIACQRDIIFHRVIGSEDCLHLNIYTKDLKPPKLCPVMVYIHGGAFIYGSNSKDFYNPEFLLRKDVIFIVVNYRLGAFGFLSLEDPELDVPGNAGLKDQVLALKWIKQNATNFGGDPNNITLFGESAGGCAVHYHMLSPMSEGLFHKAIAMSGSAMNPWALCPLKNISERLAKAVGWNGEGGTKQLIHVLRNANVANIIKAQDTLITSEEYRQMVLFPFGPVIEPFKSKQCFIPKHAKIMYKEAWSQQIPFMIGGCSGEGLILYKATKKRPYFFARLASTFERTVPRDIELDRNSVRCKELGAEIKAFYFGLSEPTETNILTYIQLVGDKEFWHGLHRSIVSRIENIPDTGPTYVYRFDFDSKSHSHSKILFAGKGIAGACHADDCSFLFKNAITGKLNENSREYVTMERMVDFWTNFARTGNPNNASKNLIVWDPVEKTKLYKCMNISDDLCFIDLPENSRMNFWDSLYEKV